MLLKSGKSENLSENRKLLKSQKKAAREKEKQRINALKQQNENIEKRNNAAKKRLKAEAAPKSCQDTIRYDYMFQNGVCQVGDNFFSKMLKFSDINYQVAERTEQIEIFSKYCELLNYFDPATNVEIIVHNRKMDKEQFKQSMLLDICNDGKDDLRQEYNRMLLDKALQGQNSIIKEKYIVFELYADDYESAYSSLMRIETDIAAHLKNMGCDIMYISGEQRLELMNSILNPSEPMKFDYDNLIGTGLCTKDFIAPYYFDFKPEGKQVYFEFGDYYGQCLMIKKFPSDLSDKLINALSEIPCNSTITIHTNSMDNSQALEMVKTKLAFVEQDIVNRQQKLLQNGNDPDLIPQHLKRRKEETTLLIDDIQNKNQRLFQGSIMVMVSSRTLEDLKENIEKLKGTARSYGCELMPVAFEQEAGLNAALPLAKNDIDIRRTLTTASQAILIPFTIQELFNAGGMYYGLNALSRNLIFFNRKGLKNPAGFVLGTPGSGKSFATKRELVNILLNSSNDEILVIDPESEYGALAENFGGELIKISNDSDTYFNPLDISTEYIEGENKDNLLSFKTEFLFSFLDVIVTKESGIGLTGAERTLVDRTLTSTYKTYFRSAKARMPTLNDFCKELEKVNIPELQEEKENLLKVLGLYTTGSFNLFSHNTNVNINNRFVIFDIKELSEQIKTLGMLVILDQVWNRITANRIIGRKTWVVVDEAHLLFNNPFSAQFLSSLWKRARKYGGICTGITQNVEDLLESDTARKMLSNSDFILMLNQAASDRDKLSKLLNISPVQLSYITNAQAGQGLLFAGNAIIPFIDKFPTDTRLYKMMTTKIDEVVNNDK